jgi:signal transduction histidine kinase
MRIATRLILTVGGAVGLVVSIYMLLSHQERQQLLRDSTEREAATLAAILLPVVEQGLVDGDLTLAERLTQAMVEDEEIFAALVLDPAGEVLAGSALHLECLRAALPEDLALVRRLDGRVNCGLEVYWSALPTRDAPATIVVAYRELLLNRAVASALRRQFLLTAALLVILTGALGIVVRRTVSRPLGAMLDAIRTPAPAGGPRKLEMARASGELAEVALAYNAMVQELEVRERLLQRVTEERIGAERRLLDAEKFAAIGRFSGGLAHEMGSPLSVISLRAEAITGEPSAAPAAVRHASEIIGQVRRLTELIENLLLLARRGVLDSTVFDLATVARTVCSEKEPWLEGLGVRLTVELDAEPAPLRGHPSLFAQALGNLLRNAGEAVHAHAETGEVRVATLTREHRAFLTVTDTGPGAPQEEIARLFEPFHTSRAERGGLGLGLPLTRAIVEEHGGELHLENGPGGGLRAIVSVPIEPPGSRPR